MNSQIIFRGGCILKNCGSTNEKQRPDMHSTEIATTILARDYKGLSNYGSNGVVEIWSKDDRQNQSDRQS